MTSFKERRGGRGDAAMPVCLKFTSEIIIRLLFTYRVAC